MTRAGVEVEVREARVEDADAIGRIHVRCWRHAYVGLVPDELLAGLSEELRVVQWQQALGGAQPERGSTLVAVDAGGTVLGFAQVGPAQDAPSVGTLGELYALYLTPEAIGTGVGRELLAAATQRLRETGFTIAQLDVLPGNDRARRVYEAAGWQADGDVFVEAQGRYQLPHQRYVRKL